MSSPEQAAALVFASNPMFTSIKPLMGGQVGQSSWYDASATGDGYTVAVTMGSGDCESSCINQHTWTYNVTAAGAVTLVSEQGDVVEVTVDHGTSDPATVTIHLVSGPVCPVERASPDPSCAPRPVPNVEVVLRDPTGAEVSRATSVDDGSVMFTVPGGAYYAEAGTAVGMMRQAGPVAFSVPGGRSVGLVMSYDTGIR